MKVLSLFDGISCGQIALNRAEIKYDAYYASEIDKYAIKVTQHNFPDTIQLGDITKIKGAGLPKIDLLIGGSPCQGFSFAGKQLNFDDPRSALFFEYVRLLRECNPTYFLLENVVMKKEYQDVISSYLGVEPIMINSSLVSAQNRKRLYWTNIPNVTQPEDRKITWRDVSLDYKDGQAVAAMRGRYLIDGKQKTAGSTDQFIEFRYDGKTNALTTVAKDNVVVPYLLKGRVKASTILSTIYKENAKSMLQRRKFGLLVNDSMGIRKLTPVECEKLQTIPGNYTSCISNSQRYKCIGNGWTVDVIAHIFKNLTFA